jgi:hypothetical protein
LFPFFSPKENEKVPGGEFFSFFPVVSLREKVPFGEGKKKRDERNYIVVSSFGRKSPPKVE